MLFVAVLAAGCHRSAPRDPQLDIQWTLTPTAPAIGPAVLTATVRDTSGNAVTGAKVRLEGHMSHAGMAPVLADGVEVPGVPGTYRLRFTFTMEGDWVLLLSVTLPDGGRTQRRIDVPRVRASG